MKQFKKYISQGITLTIVAFCFLCIFHINAEAAYTEDQENGVNYDNSVNMHIGSVSDYAQGGHSYIYIYLSNSGDRVANIKTGSKNLLAKKSKESYDINQDWYTGKETKSYSGATHIALYGKKKGKYTVTFDVLKADGTLRCTKKATVVVNPSVAAPAVKTVKYAGKEAWTYGPYTTKTSGKIKVTMNKGYQLKKIEVGKCNSKGEWKYTKVKNNKTIKLAKSEKYTKNSVYTSSTATYKYNELFPETRIRITWKNKKTKATGTSSVNLYTLNKK